MFLISNPTLEILYLFNQSSLNSNCFLKKFTLYFFFSPSLRMVPIFLSLRVSRPSLFLIVPGGKLFFFSNVPTVQSLLTLLICFLLVILAITLFFQCLIFIITVPPCNDLLPLLFTINYHNHNIICR